MEKITVIIDKDFETRYVLNSRNQAELKSMAEYLEPIVDIDGNKHIGFKKVDMLPQDIVMRLLAASPAKKTVWRRIIEQVETQRKAQAAVLCVGFCIFAGLGYYTSNAIHSEKTQTQETSQNDTVSRQAAPNGQPAGIDIAQVYPFAEAEGKEIAAASPAGKAAANRSIANYGSLPAIPQGQPRPSVPLPVIPSNSYTTSQASTAPAGNAVPEKKEKGDSYQSRIAFIGGDGVNFNGQNK